jgi:hypothetical protein
MSSGGDRRMRGQAGIVGLNLALTIAFALFAVIELSRVTLAAKQIDDRVEQITSDVGPGSNVSQLDQTAKLNDVAKKAEDILAAAKPLSGQAQVILDTAKSIDNTASSILTNADAINGTAQGINSRLLELAPVVRAINGAGGKEGGGVEAINIKAQEAMGPVGGIAADLAATRADAGQIRTSAASICSSTLIAGSGCTP